MLVKKHLTELAEHELAAAIGDHKIQLVSLSRHEQKASSTIIGR